MIFACVASTVLELEREKESERKERERERRRKTTDIGNNLSSTKPMREKIAACRAVPVTMMAGKGTAVCGVVEHQKRKLGSWELCADDVLGWL